MISRITEQWNEMSESRQVWTSVAALFLIGAVMLVLGILLSIDTIDWMGRFMLIVGLCTSVFYLVYSRQR